MRPQETELVHAFWWRDRLYGIAVERKAREYSQFSMQPEQGLISRAFLEDSSGAHVSALSSYRLLPYWDGTPTEKEHTALIETDTAGRAAFMWPDGRLALPKLAFQYGYLSVIMPQMFSVGANGARTTLVNAENKPLLPESIVVKSAYPAHVQRHLRHSVYEHHPAAIPRLCLVTALDEAAGKEVKFYVDDRGRVYYAGALKQKKNGIQ